MATELAKAYVQIIPSAQGIKDSITKELGGEAENAGKSAGSKVASFLKKAIAAAGIGAALKEAFSQGMELQQNLGGTEAVFGTFANNIQKSAKNAYKNMGMSASDYMATANKMGSLFQGSGLSQQKSLELTSQAMQRASDVASVMGLDTASAMESIAGAAKGNFTMMDNLGVAMNATTLQAYALEKGINFDWNTASQAEKSEMAMQMFMDRTSQYAGNFAKESEQTLSGSIGAMKAAYEDLLGNMTLGNDIGPSLQNLSSTVSTFLTNNFIPLLLNILMALPQALGTLFVNLAPALLDAAIQLVTSIGEGIISGAPLLYEYAMQLLGQFQGGITNQLPELLQKGVEIVTNVANGVLQNLPALIETGGQMLASFLNSIMQSLPSILSAGVTLIGNLAQGIGNNLPAIISAIATVLTNLLASIASNLPKLLNVGISLMGKMAAGIIQGIPTVISNIPTVFSKIKDAFSNIDWKSIGKNIIKGIANGLESAAGEIVEAAKSAAKKALNSAKSFLGIKSPSRVFKNEVGKMISLGLASGIEDNTKPIADAVNKARNIATGNIGTSLMTRVAYDYGTLAAGTQMAGSTNAQLIGRMDELIGVMTRQKGKIEVVTVMKDRELARTLTEMGVVFA